LIERNNRSLDFPQSIEPGCQQATFAAPSGRRQLRPRRARGASAYNPVHQIRYIVFHGIHILLKTVIVGLVGQIFHHSFTSSKSLQGVACRENAPLSGIVPVEEPLFVRQLRFRFERCGQN
jgi:hypothetical protein